MKGLSVLTAACLLGSSAMGMVYFDLVDNGDLTADLVMVCDGEDADAHGSRVAGIALDVSVDRGVIEDVYNYKTTGESVVGDKGYGIFPGSISFVDPYPRPTEIADTGTPVAEGLGTSSIVLEFGTLYDQAVPNAAPEGTTVLCTIKLSQYGTVRVDANASRGGVVLIGGSSPSATNLPADFGRPHCDCCRDEEDCVQAEQVGCPESWCNPRQCHGDADGHHEGSPFTGFYYVGVHDLNLLILGWKNPNYTNPAECPWIAADFDHRAEGSVFTGFYRVGVNDLNILIANWKKVGLSVPAPDCLD